MRNLRRRRVAAKMAKRPDEFALIERWFAPLSGSGSFGLKDDAAILTVPGDSGPERDIVVTNDAIAETVHFLPSTDPALIARKAIRTNLSDLAAKGATPFAVSLALGLPPEWDAKWISRFGAGMKSDCQAYGIELNGGDTFRSPGGAVVSITAYGHVARGGYASRLGASAGDVLFVTGTIGDAVAGLAIARREGSRTSAQRWLEKRYLLPQPRVEAVSLIERYASAAMDISDGFIGDLEKLCKASGVSVEFPAASMPVSRQARDWLSGNGRGISLEALLTGGDDYELLIAVPKANVASFERGASGLPFAVTRLGTLEAYRGAVAVRLLDSSGKAMKFNRKSYLHFGEMNGQGQE
jgi:thiamine-monophosphate kinase